MTSNAVTSNRKETQGLTYLLHDIMRRDQKRPKVLYIDLTTSRVVTKRDPRSQTSTLRLHVSWPKEPKAYTSFSWHYMSWPKEPKAHTSSTRLYMSWLRKAQGLWNQFHDPTCRDQKRPKVWYVYLTTLHIVTKSPRLKWESSRHQGSPSWHQKCRDLSSVVVSKRLTSCPYDMSLSHSRHIIWDHSQFGSKCRKDMLHISE